MNELLEILSEVKPGVDFEKETALVDDGILDSMDIVSLVTDIFNEFDVRIPADRIVPENFNSAKAMMDLINDLIEE